MIKATERFTPAADEVWRLQRGNDAECHFFQRMVNRGELITDKGTRQGIWVAAPSGRLLASVNSTNPDTVLGMLERGWKAWEALPLEERGPGRLADTSPVRRWEDCFPAQGLALERIARDLPSASDPLESAGGRWNRDFVWFSATEARAWLPKTPVEGERHDLPGDLAQRLARVVLVDNVRGQTVPYSASEIEQAWVRTTVTAVEDSRVTLTLEGSTQADSDGVWTEDKGVWGLDEALPHAMECRLVGRAVWDTEAARFVEFEATALGRRRGRTGYNARRGDSAQGSLIGFSFALAAPTPLIAPTFLRVYGADWVVSPD